MSIEQQLKELTEAVKDNTAAIREALSRSTPAAAPSNDVVLKIQGDLKKDDEEAKAPKARVKKMADGTPPAPEPEAPAPAEPDVTEPEEDGTIDDAGQTAVKNAFRDNRTRLGVAAFQPKWDALRAEFGIEKITTLRKSQVTAFVERINAF